mmetsp:Transcript_23372/g.53923  ORF Transcript_23372/g.53923 Transcript_23372/m.53923 type:complete len:388 (-) Transcript_23372:33-1196(-)
MTGIPAAQAVKVLDRYVDILSQFAVLPFFVHLKFGETLQKLRQTGEEGAAEAPFQPRLLPHATILLLTLAEVASSMSVLDPEDKLVQRAAGHFFRTRKEAAAQGGSGFSPDTFSKLLADEDIYAVFRYAFLFSGLFGTLIASLWSSAKDGSETSSFSPTAIFNRVVKLLTDFSRVLKSPELYVVVVILALAAVGNWSDLVKLAHLPMGKELLLALSRLMRTLAVVVAAFYTSPSAGSFRTWAIPQTAAAFARATSLMVYERLTPADLLDFEKTGREVMLARGAVAMEVVCVLALLPRVCGSRRGVTSTLFLLFPCGLLVPWGKTAPDPKDSVILTFLSKPTTPHSLALGVSALAAGTLFLGGIPAAGVLGALLHGLIQLHGLHKLRY